MKRKDFLRKMRQRRRRDDDIEQRQPERRRAVDWRTLRIELPKREEGAEPARARSLPVGDVILLPGEVRLQATDACWVRGYRCWVADDGETRAEFQYRAVQPDNEPPPGATALKPGETWSPGS